MTELRQEPWHVGREIPLALILTIVLAFVGQTSAIVWWASATSTRLDAVEKKLDLAAPQAERIIRLEVKMDGLSAALSEIKEILRRPLPRQ